LLSGEKGRCGEYGELGYSQLHLLFQINTSFIYLRFLFVNKIFLKGRIFFLPFRGWGLNEDFLKRQAKRSSLTFEYDR
jgi:hypothetical protein